jgi:hypothetical protein
VFQKGVKMDNKSMNRSQWIARIMKTIVVFSLSLVFVTGGCNKSVINNSNLNTANSTPVTNSNSSVTSVNNKIPFGSGPLLGKWKDKEKGVDLTMEFHSDGTYTNIYEGERSLHTYEYLSDNMIRSKSAKGKVSNGKFIVNGAQMTLTWTDSSGDATPQNFDRVDKK